jgi:hypothetical protein
MINFLEVRMLSEDLVGNQLCLPHVVANDRFVLAVGSQFSSGNHLVPPQQIAHRGHQLGGGRHGLAPANDRPHRVCVSARLGLHTVFIAASQR